MVEENKEVTEQSPVAATEAPTTEATPESQEAQTQTQESQAQPEQGEQTTQFWGRFESEDKAKEALDVAEKQVADKEAFIGRQSNEIGTYRQLFQNQLAQQQQQPMQPQQPTVQPTQPAQTVSFDDIDPSEFQENPSEVMSKKVLPAIQAAAEQAAQNANQQLRSEIQPMFDSARQQSVDAENDKLWTAIEQSDKRFNRNDPSSKMAVGMAARDFASQFGWALKSNSVDQTTMANHIFNNAVQNMNDLGKQQSQRESPVANAVQSANTTQAQVEQLSEDKQKKVNAHNDFRHCLRNPGQY